MREFNRRGIFHFLRLALILLPASGNAGPSAPSPPSNLCIDNICPPTSISIKWHPGHYVAAEGIKYNVNPTGNQAALAQALTASPQLKGIRERYTWFDFEPSRAVYNTTLIDDDIAFLNTSFPGKKLIILIELENFFRTSQPTTPQSDPAFVPDYIVDGISGLGQDVVPTGYGSQRGYYAAFWRPAVMARIIALYDYLGAKYDQNPTVEAIVGFDGTSVPLFGTSDFTADASTAQMQNFIVAVAKSWPHTTKFMYGDWMPTGMGQRQLTALVQTLYAKGWGQGGPDILPPATDWPGGRGETWGEMAVRGEDGSVGGAGYGGLMPLLLEQQSDEYLWPTLIPAIEEPYGYGAYKWTHAVWTHNTHGSPAQNWTTGVVPQLNSVAWRINSACPANYAGNCNGS